jgi:hypothetical protein
LGLGVPGGWGGDLGLGLEGLFGGVEDSVKTMALFRESEFYNFRCSRNLCVTFVVMNVLCDTGSGRRVNMSERL